MVEKKYRVTGMGCASCVVHVKNAMQALGGVERCEVDLADESMAVFFDQDTVGFDDFKKAVEDAGYGIEEV